MRLQGKVAIVTGAAHGMGESEAVIFAREGASVIVADVDADGQKVAANITGAGGKAQFVKLDVASEADWEAAIKATVAAYGRLDILVNNAGIMVEEEDADPEQEIQIVRDTMQTNVYGPLLLSRLAILVMKSRRYGRIVNLSSGMGSLTEMGAGYIAYRMSKAGLNVVTRVLAAETEGMGILVNSVDPGWVQTEMGGRGATRDLYKGAETPVWLATVPEGGPSGGFFRDRKAIPW